MMLYMKSNFFLFIFLFFVVNTANAIKEPKPMSVDKRLGIIVYSPNDVHRFTGYYGYQSSIIFAEGETIETISMGDSIPWQMVPSGNRLFLKPIDQDATTNMTLITNKRVYYFELYAKEANNINQDGLMFAVKFLYADGDNQDGSGSSNHGSSWPHYTPGPDLSNKSLYNFNYTISGPESIAPIKIFDDGKFTYFEFKDKESDLPAIFYVNKDHTEGLINYRVNGAYIVVESLRERFTLRNGENVVCVFNEKLIQSRKSIDDNEKADAKKKPAKNNVSNAPVPSASSTNK